MRCIQPPPRTPTALRWCVVAVCSLLAAVGIVHAANEPPRAALICEPPVGKTVDGKVPPPIYFNRFTRDGPLMRLEGRTDKDNRMMGAKRVAVSDDEVKQLCDQGFPIAVLDVAEIVKTAKSADRPKTVVEPVAALPPVFSIYRPIPTNTLFPWKTYGNFWVPAVMPSGHTFQVVDFTVTPSNYQSSGSFSHFGVGALVVSDSNFDHDFDGKGAAVFGGGPLGGVCNSTDRTALQSWAIQNYNDGADPPCGAYPGCSNPVFDGVAAQPATCGEWDAIAPKRFLVGANIWQGSVYWRCQPGGSCPEFVSPSIDSTTPYFRTGGAGVFFVHVRSVDVEWNLSFTNVSSYTSP